MYEFFDKVKTKCNTCGELKDCADNIVIEKTDITSEVPLHGQGAGVQSDKLNTCYDSLQVDKIHWTEAEVRCEKCQEDTMYFSEYTEGKLMSQFKEDALKSAESFPRVIQLKQYQANHIYL